MKVDIHKQIEAVKREIAMRERVYHRMVLTERLSQEDADDGIAIMKAILKTLEEIANPPLFK